MQKRARIGLLPVAAHEKLHEKSRSFAVFHPLQSQYVQGGRKGLLLRRLGTKGAQAPIGGVTSVMPLDVKSFAKSLIGLGPSTGRRGEGDRACGGPSTASSNAFPFAILL